MKNKMTKKIKLDYSMELVTGLHIGDSSDNVEIGGIDKPVIRKTIENIPYIPGSSLKGKIRSLLEQIAGASEVGNNSEINDLFGFAKDNKPSKLIVRDAYLSEKSQNELENSEFVDMPYTEVKFENTIERITGKAKNPRQIERIPAGAKFDVEFVINIWDNDNDGKDLLLMLERGIHALENDYLGGSGSRGYGQVKFSEPKKTEITFENYFADEN
ncbi:MAG: type III-A CRISPR-associated RAMP protein Csm3 [Bacteroidota bacterium]